MFWANINVNIYIVLSFKVNEIILNIKYLLFVVVQTWNKRPADINNANENFQIKWKEIP